MNGPGGFRKPAAVTLAIGALVMVTALTLAACGSGTTVTATPQASGGTGKVQPAERHGHLGDAIVLSDGGKGQLEATALGLKFMSNIATKDSTVSNVYGVKLKLRNVGSTPIHLAAVGANSVLFDAGGWRYFPPGANPKNALNEVDLGPGASRAGWVYFAVQVTGGAPRDFGAPNDFQYTAKSSDATAEGDTGHWKWTPSTF
jgi:hypothetical protein